MRSTPGWNALGTVAALLTVLAVVQQVRGGIQEDRAMLKNGNFEQWRDGEPAGWKVGHGHYERDEVMKIAGMSALRMSTDRMQPDRWLSTRLEQRFDLTPNRAYRLRLWMAKDGEGKVLVRIRPIRQGKVAEAVLDWSNGWARLFAWTPVALEFRSGDDTRYELSIIQFGSPGEPMWIDAVEIEPRDGEAAIEPGDRKRGFELYCPPVMVPFDARNQVAAEDTPQLRLTAARGEYAAGILGLRALQRLEGVDVRLKGDLIGADGARLQADAVTVRMIGDQALLPPSRARTVDAGRNLGWWITVHAGETQAAGVYRGTLEVMVNGKPVAEAALSLEVLGLTLPEPDIAFLVYHNERYFPAGGFLTDKLRQAYYDDMRAHGMNTVTVYNNPDVDGKRIDFDYDHAYGKDVFDYEALNKKGYSLTAEAVQKRFDHGLNSVMPMILKSGLCASGQPVLWLPYKPGRYNWGGMPREAMKKTVQAWLGHKDWPTPLLYVNDEPEGHPDRIAEAQRVLKEVKSWNLPVQTVTANVAVKELGDDYDVWIQLDRRMNPEMAQAAREHTAALWVYDCNMPADNAPFTRAMYGFWAYRAGVKGVVQWAYYDALNWYMDAEGTVHGTNGQFDLSRICPSPDGPVPTVSWESTRLGVDDYRYALLFGRLIQEASDKADKLLKQAREVLSDKDIATLDARQKQLDRKPKPDEKPIAWKPANEAQAKALALYREGRRLEREAAMARQVKEQLIDSIPSDALAVSRAMPFMAANHEFYPALGPGDPRTAAADKRRALTPYVMRLQAALGE